MLGKTHNNIYLQILKTVYVKLDKAQSGQIKIFVDVQFVTNVIVRHDSPYLLNSVGKQPINDYFQ